MTTMTKCPRLPSTCSDKYMFWPMLNLALNLIISIRQVLVYNHVSLNYDSRNNFMCLLILSCLIFLPSQAKIFFLLKPLMHIHNDEHFYVFIVAYTKIKLFTTRNKIK